MNGLLCPACFSILEKCFPTSVMKCTGRETACIQLNAVISKVALSGCASVTYCRVHPLIGESFWNNDNMLRPVTLSCENANKTSSLPVANYLSCKECYGVNCDRIVNCSPEKDACLTIILRTTQGTKNHTGIMKRCGFSSECNSVGSITTGEKDMTKNVTCCYSNNCIPPIPTLPLENNTVNGILCQSCYYKTYGICTGLDYIACTGKATQCISYSSEQKDEYFTSREVFQGCGHPTLCRSGNRTVVDEYVTLKETVISPTLPA
ncbi:phospholipase A2 inhibitor and Ly6/PLAUR domain-containing protein-like [Dendropsophus ebraccatus]|uniref:phospholipase A2 inhibitor and Ly6/PLAUR domain-containing protein-like n=1 Tax=Dendropsophus ebraccatus TaxID=150705 RepID=UPI003831AB72